jgi:hypothetical protein
MEPAIPRRKLVQWLLSAGVIASLGGSQGCAPADRIRDFSLPQQPESVEGVQPQNLVDNVDALFDLFIPAERSPEGTLLSAGARECMAERVLRIENFARLALARGLLPQSAERAANELAGGVDAFREAVNLTLDAWSAVERPLARFRDLSQDAQARVIGRAFDDPARAPAMLLLRAAAFTGYLGGIESDLGLRAVGHPAFEAFGDGLAISGYPRAAGGRLVTDMRRENLSALAAKGLLDDYTYNLAPGVTAGLDLARVLDANGDLP